MNTLKYWTFCISVIFASCSKSPQIESKQNQPAQPNQPIVIGGQNVMLLDYVSEKSTDSIFTNSTTGLVEKITFRAGLYHDAQWNFSYPSSKVIIRSRPLAGVLRHDTITLNSNGTIDSFQGYFTSGPIHYKSYQSGDNPKYVYLTNGNTPAAEQYFYSGGNLDSFDSKAFSDSKSALIITFDYGGSPGASVLHSSHLSLKKMYDFGVSDRRASLDESKKAVLMGLIYSAKLPTKMTYQSGLQPKEVYNITYTVNSSGDVTDVFLNNSKYVSIRY